MKNQQLQTAMDAKKRAAIEADVTEDAWRPAVPPNPPDHVYMSHIPFICVTSLIL